MKMNFGKLWSPYRIYRAIKSGARPYIAYRKGEFHFTWASSIEQMKKKFLNPFKGDKWVVKPLFG